MAFFSKSGNKTSSSSGDDGSATDSESEKNRFYKKTNYSERQQSSSAAASSSDSESEQVSTLPAVDKHKKKPYAPPSLTKKPDAPPSLTKKPDAPSSPNKKPDDSNRSAVRNQGTTPSELNPKAPSSSKVKKSGVGKRCRDDDAAEEQPELKKLSKGKKPTEEVGHSSPAKKNQRKQEQESAAIAAVATPPGMDSTQKSLKKTVHIWADNDETVIMHGCMICLKEGLEIPKNTPQLLERIKDSLSQETSKSQLYDKLRRMKGRYKAVKNKMVQGNIKEDAFAYKSLHEKELYQLWDKAWGEQPEGDEMEVRPVVVGDVRSRAGEEQITSAGDRAEENEEEEKVDSDAGTNTVEDPKAYNTVEAPVSNYIPVKALVSSTPMLNDNPEERIVYETIMKEISDAMTETTSNVKNVLDKSQAEIRALLDSHSPSTNGTRPAGARAGAGAERRIDLVARLRSMEPDMEKVYSVRELPAVDEARNKETEGKWRELQLLELKASSQRLALLQEDCFKHIESLKGTRGNAIP